MLDTIAPMVLFTKAIQKSTGACICGCAIGSWEIVQPQERKLVAVLSQLAQLLEAPACQNCACRNTLLQLAF